jgi:putative flippase GtrA
MTNAALLAVEGGPELHGVSDVEIVIPVYNEQADLEVSIRRLHRYLTERFPLSWQVTIADNASRDATWSIACRLAAELNGVRAVHLDQKGRGRALRATWSASTATVVAYMDVDLSTDLAGLLPLVAPLLSGHSDVAIGSRLAPGARVVRGPKREVISRSYNLILKAALRNGFSDAQCGFKAVRTQVAHALLPLVEDDGWFFDTELLVLAEHNGLRIHEVPVDWVDDQDSRVRVATTAKDDLKGICRVLRRFASGGGTLPNNALPALDRPHGLAGQLVRFVSIGSLTTALFAVIFLLLVGPLGPVAADVVALGVGAAANIAANRRVTFVQRGRAGRRRHYRTGLALAALPLVGTVATLVSLGAAGVGSVTTDLLAVTAVNAAMTAARFVLLRQWVFQSRSSAWSARLRLIRKLIRYVAVSAIATTVSSTILGVLVATNAASAGWANVIATAVGTIPSFELNRRWVWAKAGRRSLLGEVWPFCALSFTGLALSTVAVSVAAGWASSAGLGTTTRTVAAEAASVTSFATMWVGQYLILDRILFSAKVIDP